jgi:hypothetical protein
VMMKIDFFGSTPSMGSAREKVRVAQKIDWTENFFMASGLLAESIGDDKN